MVSKSRRTRCKPISLCKLWKLQSELLDQHSRGMRDWIILQSGSALGLNNHIFANPPSHLSALLSLDVDLMAQIEVFIVCTEMLVCTWYVPFFHIFCFFSKMHIFRFKILRSNYVWRPGTPILAWRASVRCAYVTMWARFAVRSLRVGTNGWAGRVRVSELCFFHFYINFTSSLFNMPWALGPKCKFFLHLGPVAH